MKKLLTIMLFMITLILVSCSSNQAFYENLDNCIDEIVEAEDDEVVTQKEKSEILSSYIELTSSDYTFEIDKDITYYGSTVFEAIEFGITFYGDDVEFTKEDVELSLSYFDSILDDLTHMNDEVYYNFSMKYNEFAVMELEYTNELLYKKLDIIIENADDIEDLFYRYEDLIIDLGNNESLDSVDIQINALDYEIRLTLNLNLGIYMLALGQMDSNSSQTFENIIRFVDESMKETDLIPIELY